MGTTVSYYCPHCEAIVELEREGYLNDKAVTPYPFEGWLYVAPDEEFSDADGVAFSCGEDGTLREGEEGCGKKFYLSFVRFEKGREIDPRHPSESVELADDTPTPSGTDSPRGPSGPGGFW